MKLIYFLILLFPVVSLASEMQVPIRYVTDGDTIAGTFQLPYPLSNISIRIYGIDTPEKGSLAKCPKEAELANQASALTKKLVGDTKVMTVQNFKYDKYGGRVDGVVIVNGINIGDELIKANLAYPYFGGAKRSWCK